MRSKYNDIFHTQLRWLKRKINQGLNPQKPYMYLMDYLYEEFEDCRLIYTMCQTGHSIFMTKRVGFVI